MGSVDWLAKRAELSPNKIGIIDDSTDRRLTYQELDGRTIKLAFNLNVKYRVNKGDRIAILAYNRLEYIYILFAAQKLGAILVPINFRLSAKEINFILQDCQPRVLFYDLEMEQMVKEITSSFSDLYICRLDEPDGSDGEYSQMTAQVAIPNLPPVQNDPESIWLILYTGGTTGFPKGVMLSQRMVTWNAINTIVSWQLRDLDIAPVFTPFFHTGGLNVLTTPLIYLGGTIIISKNFAAAKALEIITREKVTIIFMIPTMFQMLAQEPAFETTGFESVRICISGGAPCQSNIYQTYKAKGLAFKQGYGLTEAGPNCFYLHPDDLERKQGSVGKSVFHSETKIIDDNGQQVSNGVGEILIRGDHLCSGYWHKQEATASAFSDGWLHTGDIGRRDEEGYYYIVGRKKEMIISGGENIYPVEVESVLYEHPSIDEAAVVGIPHEKWGEVPKAFIVLKPGTSLNEKEVITYCRNRLAGYKVPKHVEFRTELPHSAAGKILKRELA